MKYSVAIAPWALDTAPVLYRGDIYESAEKIKSAGYDAIEIHIKEPSQIDSEKLQEYCQKTGLEVSAFATGMANVIDKLSFIDDRQEIRDKTVERVIDFVKLASKIKAGIIIGSLRGNIPDKLNRAKYDNRFYDCMSRILNVAEEKNVKIFLEAINRYENNYLNTAEETLEYIKPLDSDKLLVHLDTFHMNIEESDMAEAIKLCGDKLGYIHVADNNRKYVGAGAIDFSKVLEAAKSIGYKGYLSLECLPLPDPDTAIVKTMIKLKSISSV